MIKINDGGLLMLWGGLIVIALILIVVMPFIQIWAVNTLFKTSIEYSLLNWFAVIILNTSIRNFSVQSQK